MKYLPLKHELKLKTLDGNPLGRVKTAHWRKTVYGEVLCLAVDFQEEYVVLAFNGRGKTNKRRKHHYNMGAMLRRGGIRAAENLIACFRALPKEKLARVVLSHEFTEEYNASEIRSSSFFSDTSSRAGQNKILIKTEDFPELFEE